MLIETFQFVVFSLHDCNCLQVELRGDTAAMSEAARRHKSPVTGCE